MQETPQFGANLAFAYVSIADMTTFETFLKNRGMSFTDNESSQRGTQEYRFVANFDQFNDLLSASQAQGIQVIMQREPLGIILDSDVIEKAVNDVASGTGAGGVGFTTTAYTVPANRRFRLTSVTIIQKSGTYTSMLLLVYNLAGATVMSYNINQAVNTDVSPTSEVYLEAGYQLIYYANCTDGSQGKIGFAGLLTYA